MRAAGKIVMNGSAADVREFLEVGQHIQRPGPGTRHDRLALRAGRRGLTSGPGGDQGRRPGSLRGPAGHQRRTGRQQLRPHRRQRRGPGCFGSCGRRQRRLRRTWCGGLCRGQCGRRLQGTYRCGECARRGRGGRQGGRGVQPGQHRRGSRRRRRRLRNQGRRRRAECGELCQERQQLRRSGRCALSDGPERRCSRRAPGQGGLPGRPGGQEPGPQG
ncbi:ALF repeat-containing protein [Streptomyces sp. SM11]|uniref:ALF repeat-containing protein n=1 Tax=Streptomyces sp. SM11 TaxID=565557 RepID=UPI0021560B99|nr:ALF repeat-containing protein [Streptomyces sp. SM11]